MINGNKKKWKPDVERAWQIVYARACGDSLMPEQEILKNIIEEDMKKILG